MTTMITAMSKITARAFTAALLAALACTGEGSAQTAPATATAPPTSPSTAPPTAPPTAPSTTPAQATGADSPPAVAARPPTAARRAPVLREGSHLVEVTGRIRRDPVTRALVFTIDDTVPHELTIIPSTLLAELDRMIQWADPEQQLIFEISGEVLVYRGLNYLTLTHPPVLVGQAPSMPTGMEVQAVPEEDGETARDDDRPASEIIRDLERAAGPVARRAPGPAPLAGNEVGENLVREGTVLIARRGKIRRAGGGGYTFVFDADAEGLADPPMTLLPCLMLERLELLAQQSGDQAAVLLTGQVFAYRNQNYVLPSVFVVPRERTTLHP